MNYKRGNSPPRRGGVDALSMKWIRSEIGAAGVVSSANFFRPQDFAGLTTPAAASSVASQLLLMPQPSPPLGGGESPQHLDNLFTPSSTVPTVRWKTISGIFRLHGGFKRVYCAFQTTIKKENIREHSRADHYAQRHAASKFRSIFPSHT